MTRLLDRPRSRSDVGDGAERGGEAPTVTEDPRIAARRAEIADEGRAHRRRRMATFALPVALLALVVAASLSPLASVRTVRVVGAERTSAADVTAASGLAARPPMPSVDPAAVARRVAALPWVGTVRVRRAWPTTVHIEVVERKAVALLPAAPGPGCDSAPCLAAVDATGRVLELGALDGGVAGTSADAVRVVGLPDAPGPGASVEPAGLQAIAVAAGLPEALRPLVGRVEVDEAGEVGLRLSGQGKVPGALVRLGSADRMATKLTAAATVLDRVPRGGLTVVDVRVPEAPVLTRAGSPATVSPSPRG